jgi:hypothetical protein
MTSEAKRSAKEPLLKHEPITVSSIYKLYPEELV